MVSSNYSNLITIICLFKNGFKYSYSIPLTSKQIYLIDRCVTLIGIITPGQSGPESNGNKEDIPPSLELQNWRLTTGCSFMLYTECHFKQEGEVLLFHPDDSHRIVIFVKRRLYMVSRNYSQLIIIINIIMSCRQYGHP